MPTKQKLTGSFRDKLARLELRAKGAVVGREEVIRLFIRAILTKNHLLLVGTHGTAKSMIARALFSAIDARVFATQLGSESTTENLFGAMDLKAYKEDAEIRYNTRRSVVNCEYAFIDEFMDAPPGLRRNLLEILFERRFTKGSHDQHVPLWTCIATTNFDMTDARDKAVFDRFMLQTRVNRLSGVDRIALLEQVVAKSTQDVIDPSEDDCFIAHDEICEACNDVKRMPVSASFVRDMSNLVDRFCKVVPSEKLWPSDRRLVNALDIFRAEAYLSGHKVCEDPNMLLGAASVLFPMSDAKTSEMLAAITGAFQSEVAALYGVMHKFDRADRVEKLVGQQVRLFLEDTKEEDFTASAQQVKNAMVIIHALDAATAELSAIHNATDWKRVGLESKKTASEVIKKLAQHRVNLSEYMETT